MARSVERARITFLMAPTRIAWNLVGGSGSAHVPFAGTSKQTMEDKHGTDEPAGQDSSANGERKPEPAMKGSPSPQLPRPPDRSSRRPRFNVGDAAGPTEDERLLNRSMPAEP